MLRIVLGVIAGFIAWSILWVGGNQVFDQLSPGWYGAHHDKVAVAVANGARFESDTTIILIGLVLSIIASLMAGFLAAVIARGNRNAPLFLGILLLIVGVAVQAQLWNVFPVWYHIIFLALLIPMSILGGRLKRRA
ncbi:MAG: hypothetical protein DMF62_08735 [Acidobacteria bacterium]|nr:MAG: hypothetical protein DMF62_08735 [Acidobacteriota bacterium]